MMVDVNNRCSQVFNHRCDGGDRQLGTDGVAVTKTTLHESLTGSLVGGVAPSYHNQHGNANAITPTAWVSLYNDILDTIVAGRGDDFMSVSTSYKLHGFLSNAHLTNDNKPINKTWENDLGVLIESWYPLVYNIYLCSELISSKLLELLMRKGLDTLIWIELESYRRSVKAQSIESKIWCHAVSCVV